MNAGQHDHDPHDQNHVPPDKNHDTEPADPDSTTCDHSARRELPLAPATVKPSRLPNPFITDDGRPETVAEAGETYLKVQRANWNDDSLTSKYERHKFETYPRILEADRHFQVTYNDLTTAMLTRRLSPLDSRKNWLTPWECNEMLHGGKVHRSVRESLDYQLDNFEFEWLAVTAPTRSAGTPHEHIYLWIDDYANEVGPEHISTALDKHLKYCANAYPEHHRYEAGGTSGAITVDKDPCLVDYVPDKFSGIADESGTYAATGEIPPNTRGAQYLASQLAHLPLADFYAEDRPDPPQPLFEGAALAWASPRDWFRVSGGVPALESQ